jgi:hypothetical protein
VETLHGTTLQDLNGNGVSDNNDQRGASPFAIMRMGLRDDVRAKSGLDDTHLVLRCTTSGSLNPILADADAGVVSIVVVVGDKGFVRCGELAAAALSMHSAQSCQVSGQSLHSFIQLSLHSC